VAVLRKENCYLAGKALVGCGGSLQKAASDMRMLFPDNSCFYGVRIGSKDPCRADVALQLG